MRLLKESLRAAGVLLEGQRRAKWVVLVVLAVLAAAFETVGAALIFILVGLVSGASSGLTLPVVGDLTRLFPDTDLRTLQISTAVLVACFFAVRAVVVVGQQYLQARVIQLAGAVVATQLVRGYLAMSYLYHSQRNSAEMVRNAFDSTQRLVGQVLMPLVSIMSETILVVALAAVLLVLSPLATVLAVVGLGTAVLALQRIVQPRLKVLGRRSQDARGRTLLSLQQAMGGFRDIRLFGREAHFLARFDADRTELARAEYAKTALSWLPRTLIETALVLIIVAIFMTAVLTGAGLDTVIATLGVFAYVGLRLQPSLQIVVTALSELRFGSAIVADLEADFVQARQAAAALGSRTGATGSLTIHDRLTLEKVSFRYAPDGPAALDRIDLEIPQGAFIGICGPTGGGKSTLIDVLTGLLRPTEGHVRVDGVDLAGHEAEWRAQLGVVSQSVFLTDDTLRANIAFGQDEAEIDEAALRRAVSRAQLDDVVSALPAGLETLIGERGVRLSGGQRQRVAIARALYREPSVVVFDEGTSALDSATEAALVSALDDLRAGRTFIAVAHRISTVRGADRIVVIDRGRIVAQDSHEALLDSSPLFRSLAR